MHLNHLHIKTPDLQKTRKFYQDYFGFRPYPDNEHFLIGQDGFLLAIVQYKDGEPQEKPPEGLHYGFCLDARDEVENLFKRMKSDGLKFQSELNTEDATWINFYCYDPSGFEVEVSWSPKDVEQMKPTRAASAKA